MDTAKTKKLEEYALVLERQAQSEESQGNGNEAAKIYVKLIDIFLLLAREAPDHPTWVKYATRAEGLQKKTKELIVSSNEGNSQQGKTGAIKKMFGIKPSEEKKAGYDTGVEKTHEQTSIPARPTTPASVARQDEISLQEPMVPKRLYDELLERSKQLESRASTMVDRSEYNALEAKCNELSEKLSSVPLKSEFDELRYRLSNSVPRMQYEELQKAFVNLIPKETYNAAQARIAELESQLENSIPKTVLEDLANEVSFLTVTAAIPMTQTQHVEITGNTQVPTALRENNSPPPSFEQNDLQYELLMMKEKIDLLEVKIKASRAEGVKS